MSWSLSGIKCYNDFRGKYIYEGYGYCEIVQRRQIKGSFVLQLSWIDNDEQCTCLFQWPLRRTLRRTCRGETLWKSMGILFCTRRPAVTVNVNFPEPWKKALRYHVLQLKAILAWFLDESKLALNLIWWNSWGADNSISELPAILNVQNSIM